MPVNRSIIAYFSMEIGLEPEIPTYSGGLGVLAGDTIRSAADAGLGMVAVTLLSRQGYFRQELDQDGNQSEHAEAWAVEDRLREMPGRAVVQIEGRDVLIRAWCYELEGVEGDRVRVFFLDTDLEANAEADRHLTDQLYHGDERYRLCQEVILGIGGIRMLRALGYKDVTRYHMNEGHAALLSLELLAEQVGDGEVKQQHIDAVRGRCVFTTHTPVQAAHDSFSHELVRSVLGDNSVLWEQESTFCCDGTLDLTMLALYNSDYINGVAKRHGEVSRAMYGQYSVDFITNGVHAASWMSESMAELLDAHIADWRHDNLSLRGAIGIPGHEVRDAHRVNKKRLLEYVHGRTGVLLEEDVLTLGYARRFTAYKRPELFFMDLERLVEIARRSGPIQLVYSGKAHPRDEPGKALIRLVFEAAKRLRRHIPVVFLEDYGIEQARVITSGVDIWLNTPQPPMEASGTSGMKAAINGVPSFSVLDGWWVEGCIEGVTGWSIGEQPPDNDMDPEVVANQLYTKLQTVIMPVYYNDFEEFGSIMRASISLNGSFFNTERMIQEYIAKAYFR